MSKAFKDFKTLPALTAAMSAQGIVEDMQVIIAVDCTASNRLAGLQSFADPDLHRGEPDTPYSSLIRLLGDVVSCDRDGAFPLYFFGFLPQYGDAGPLRQVGVFRTADQAADAYRSTIRTVQLNGPTEFAPVIKRAIEHSKQGYTLLIILADGVVLNPQKELEALCDASDHPLSVVCVGLGDGPFDAMHELDDHPKRVSGLRRLFQKSSKLKGNRRFDNFQFVKLSDIVKADRSRPGLMMTREVREALLLGIFGEVPQQYEAIRNTQGYKPKPVPARGEKEPPAYSAY